MPVDHRDLLVRRRPLLPNVHACVQAMMSSKRASVAATFGSGHFLPITVFRVVPRCLLQAACRNRRRFEPRAALASGARSATPHGRACSWFESGLAQGATGQFQSHGLSAQQDMRNRTRTFST